MYTIKKYPDNTSYVESEYGSDKPFITFRINSYEDLWHLNQLVDALNAQNKIPTIFIPNLLDAQADRRFERNQSSGLKLVCEFLNKMKANFIVFHPHNPEVVEALIDNVTIVDNTDFIKSVIYNDICVGPGFPDVDLMNNLILMSSDAGGFKPLMKLCNKINWKGETSSASKSRTYTKEGVSQLSQMIPRIDFGGKDILIIDDICVYGGTFKGLATMLRDCNVGKLYLAVSHMTIEFLGKDSVTNYFDKVFTTNSKFETYYVPQGDGGVKPSNLEIIKI